MIYELTPEQVSFSARDFVSSTKIQSTGLNKLDVTVELVNPLAEPICIYEGVMDGVEVAAAKQPYLYLRGLVDHPLSDDPKVYAGGALPGSEPVAHSRQNEIREDQRYWPAIEILPGATYSLRQARDYGKTVVLHANGRNLPDEDALRTARSSDRYQIAFRGLQIFRCKRLSETRRRKINRVRFAFDQNLQISPEKPYGAYWLFKNEPVGSEFRLNLVAPMQGWIWMSI